MFSTWRMSLIMLPSSRTSAPVASSLTKTSSSILLRTSFVFAVAARTTGMNTPSTSAVIRIVANAARLGAALRRSARSASRRKKNGLTPGTSCPVGPARFVADHAALVHLDHPPPHAIHHLTVVRGDDHGRARTVD